MLPYGAQEGFTEKTFLERKYIQDIVYFFKISVLMGTSSSEHKWFLPLETVTY